MRFQTIIAAILLIASCCAVHAADLGGGVAYDYLSTGESGHVAGVEAHGVYDGLEVGYRLLSGSGVSANGPTLDYGYRFHTFLVTGGVDYNMVSQHGLHENSFGWRVGGGVQFGPVRTIMRYETFNHSNGLTLTIGLEIAP